MSKNILIILLLFLIFIPTVQASEVVYVNDEVKVGDWTFILASIIDNQTVVIRFQDGLIHQINQSGSIEGVKITVIETFEEYEAQTIDGAKLETKLLWEFECETDEDCNDNRACTYDSCVGYQKNCEHKTIIKCETGDGCCPSGCIYKNDNDCPQYNCEDNQDCNDNDTSTNDKCVNRFCEYTNIKKCIDNDDYCPNGCFFSYDIREKNADNDCFKDNLCISNADCNDGQEDTVDYCTAEDSTQQKKCFFILFSGDFFDTEIIEEKTTTASPTLNYEEDEKITACNLKGETKNDNNKPFYCSGYIWSLQKVTNSTCIENFECLSQKCVDFRCQTKAPTFQERITGNNLRIVAISGVGLFMILYGVLYGFLVKKLK